MIEEQQVILILYKYLMACRAVRITLLLLLLLFFKYKLISLTYSSIYLSTGQALARNLPTLPGWTTPSHERGGASHPELFVASTLVHIYTFICGGGEGISSVVTEVEGITPHSSFASWTYLAHLR